MQGKTLLDKGSCPVTVPHGVAALGIESVPCACDLSAALSVRGCNARVETNKAVAKVRNVAKEWEVDAVVGMEIEKWGKVRDRILTWI